MFYRKQVEIVNHFWFERVPQRCVSPAVRLVSEIPDNMQTTSMLLLWLEWSPDVNVSLHNRPSGHIQELLRTSSDLLKVSNTNVNPKISIFSSHFLLYDLFPSPNYYCFSSILYSLSLSVNFLQYNTVYGQIRLISFQHLLNRLWNPWKTPTVMTNLRPVHNSPNSTLFSKISRVKVIA